MQTPIIICDIKDRMRKVFGRPLLHHICLVNNDRRVILIKSSYDIFAHKHFFALLENWANWATLGATVTHDMSHLS